MWESPLALSLLSAAFSAVGTMLIQRGLRRSNFYAGFWINVAVGVVGLWTAVLLFVPVESWDWSALPYFVFSGVVGTACGRLFRVAAIEKVGGPVAAAISNLAPLIATVLAVLLLHERVTLPIVTGTLVIVALAFGPVSVVSPLSATAPLFVLLLAFLFPSGVQRLTWRVAIGTLLIVVGVFLISALKSG